MQSRNAASVFPDPVGAEIRTSCPSRIFGHPCTCGSVGLPKRVVNHSVTKGSNKESTNCYCSEVARRRFFVDGVRNGIAELRGDDARHLTRVLRAAAGERYELSDNQSAYLAEIAEARGDRVVFRILEPVASPEWPVRITLLASLIKFDRFEWMIEKATELGVEQIVPVEATRSDKGLCQASQKRAERWRRIAREASQQSRRVRVPEILPAVRFKVALAEPMDYRYFLEEAMAPSLIRMLPAYRTRSGRVALFVGPEGGWTDDEREAANAAGWQPISLGPMILRSETAAAVAIGVIMNAWY